MLQLYDLGFHLPPLSIRSNFVHLLANIAYILESSLDLILLLARGSGLVPGLWTFGSTLKLLANEASRMGTFLIALAVEDAQ